MEGQTVTTQRSHSSVSAALRTALSRGVDAALRVRALLSLLTGELASLGSAGEVKKRVAAVRLSACSRCGRGGPAAALAALKLED